MKKNMKSVLIYVASCAVLMLAASCNKEIAVSEEQPRDGQLHELEVSVPVTVTKSTYDASSHKSTYESGDAIYLEVSGTYNATEYSYKGKLDYTSGTANAVFTGKLYGTADIAGISDIITDCANLMAILLPKGYASVGYLEPQTDAEGHVTGVTTTDTKAFAAGDKDAAVPMVALSKISITNSTNTAKSLEFNSQNAVLFFTLNGLSGSSIKVSVTDGTNTLISDVNNVPVTSGAVTFAVGLPASADAKNYVLYIDGEQAVAVNTALTANKVYTITRAASIIAPIDAEFSVSSTKKVKFSKGNLQLTGENTWKFADNQYDYFGDTQSDNHRDIFGWGTGNNPNQTSNDNSDYSIFIDWGAAASNELGLGWRTLTSEEWQYLFNDDEYTNPQRSGRSGLGTYGGVNGIILIPDGVNIPSFNSDKFSSFDSNSWDENFDNAEAVFLPAAIDDNDICAYWSSTLSGDFANIVFCLDGIMLPSYGSYRFLSGSVRLVQEVVPSE